MRPCARCWAVGLVLGIVSGAALAWGDAGPVGAVEGDPERAAIARTIDASIGWFKDKDFDLLFRVHADDPDFFLFQPTSSGTLLGSEAFRKLSAIWHDPANRYLRHEVRDLRIHVHPRGEVAWFSAILDDCGEYAGKTACWKDTRWTGVLEKRERRWVIMQMHFSFAADRVLAERRAAESQTGDVEAARTAVRAVLRSIGDAWTHARWNELQACFHEQIVTIAPNGQVVGAGREASVASYVDFMGRARVERLTESEPQVFVTQRTALALQSYELAWELGGEKKQDGGREVFLFAQEQGRWLATARLILPPAGN